MKKTSNAFFGQDFANWISYKKDKHTELTVATNFKKHHWFLAGLLVMGCSWFTHSTTATIPNKSLNTEKENDINSLLASFEKELSLSKALDRIPDIQLMHTVKSGDTLGTIFSKLDLNPTLPYKISQDQLGAKLKRLSIGKTLEFVLDYQDYLKQIKYSLSPLQQLVIGINNDDIETISVVDVPHEPKRRIVNNAIESSLYETALESGMNDAQIMNMVTIFGWDIDFVLDIRKGDSFTVVYDDYVQDDEILTSGPILAAQFTSQGQTHQAIRFTDDNGHSSYYTPEGESMRGTFLRSPVEFSRISSRFSLKRYHPVLKKWRAHKGVDYAASKGTPIRATADGKLTHVGRKGGYGKTVIIRHAGRFSTLYAHMSGYAKKTRSGRNVKQGDIIGYIGSTGLATGPHLHYEFRMDGVHRNPLTYKSPKAEPIAEKYRSAFNQLASNWLAQIDSFNTNNNNASNIVHLESNPITNTQ